MGTEYNGRTGVKLFLISYPGVLHGRPSWKEKNCITKIINMKEKKTVVLLLYLFLFLLFKVTNVSKDTLVYNGPTCVILETMVTL